MRPPFAGEPAALAGGDTVRAEPVAPAVPPGPPEIMDVGADDVGAPAGLEADAEAEATGPPPPGPRREAPVSPDPL